MAIPYPVMLRELNRQHTYYEMETLLGLSHGGQGKTIRRWIAGTRTPSQSAQDRISALFYALLESYLYVEPFKDPERTFRAIKRDYARKKDAWRKLTGKALVNIIWLNLQADDKDYQANFHIISTLAKLPRRIDTYRYLDKGWCEYKVLIRYLAFAVIWSGHNEWRYMRDGLLAQLKTLKPGVYRQLKRAVGSL